MVDVAGKDRPFRLTDSGRHAIGDGGEIEVCKDGSGIDFSEELAKKVLSCDEVYILVDLKSGAACATAYGCDLTYDYVKINGDYRT